METLKDYPIRVTVWTAVIVVVAIVGFFVAANNRLNAVESSIKHLNGKTELYTERYEETIKQQTELKIRLTAIDTKLIGLETILFEIKKGLNVY